MNRACIIALPIKIQGKTRDLGANLMGRHPDDELIIIFDEALRVTRRLNGDEDFC